MSTTSISVSLGPGKEFQAEGPEELIRDQFNRFLKAVAPDSDWPHPLLLREALLTPFELMQYAFCISTDGQLRIQWKHLKTVQADQMLVALYGLLVLKFKSPASPAEIRSLLKQSALKRKDEADRVDRLADARRDCFVREGHKRGSRYSLTSEGIQRAESVIARMKEASKKAE